LWHILHRLGYCWGHHCECTIQFQFRTHNLSVWVNLHKYCRFILLFAFCTVTFLSYSNSQFVIFKYFKLNLIIRDFSSWAEPDIKISHLPVTFEQIFQKKTFWIDSLINSVQRKILNFQIFSFKFEKYLCKTKYETSTCFWEMGPRVQIMFGK
jgi:hypothetical protein